MASVKGFWRDSATGRIYAMESTPFGKILGAAGPLDENSLRDLADYDYKPGIVNWLEDALAENRLHRINPANQES